MKSTRIASPPPGNSARKAPTTASCCWSRSKNESSASKWATAWKARSPIYGPPASFATRSCRVSRRATFQGASGQARKRFSRRSKARIRRRTIPRERPAGPESSALQYVVIGIIVGFLAGLILSQGLRRARALLGAVLSFMVAQAASIAWGMAAAGVTAVLLWLVLSASRRPAAPTWADDWSWYSSGGGGWSGGSSDGGFGGGGGDFGGGGASGDW